MSLIILYRSGKSFRNVTGKVAAVMAVLVLLSVAPPPVLADIELFGGNPLLEAIKANDPQRAETAIANGENKEVQDFDRRRPLIYAALVGSLEIVELLLKKSVAVNHQDKLGNSALFYAVSQGDSEIAEMLIGAGAKTDLNNRQGSTPLIAAAKLGHLDVAQLLLSKGADPNVRDYTGRTALMWAEWNRKASLARLLRNATARK